MGNQKQEVANGEQVDYKNQFEVYRKRQEQGNKTRKTGEEILEKFFVPRKTNETFRLLPRPKNSTLLFDEAFFHVVPTNIKGGKVKDNTVLYCPAHNDPKVQKLDSDGKPMLDGNGKIMMIPAPCPCCEKYKKELAKQDQSLKGIKKENMDANQSLINEKNKKIFAEANKWEAKKFYIAKGIDKGQIKHGVKFWRFKHNYLNKGTLEKLLPVLSNFIDQNQYHYSDPQHGADLIFTLTETKSNKGFTYKEISAIIANKPTPLHPDSVVVEQWLNDPITWRDVFKAKKTSIVDATKYLELVVKGQSPYWEDSDVNNKHWVYPGNPELEKQANTRTANLDKDENEDFEQASDINDQPAVSVSNVTKTNVGAYSEDAVDLTSKTGAIEDEVDEQEDEIPEGAENTDDYTDLPF